MYFRYASKFHNSITRKNVRQLQTSRVCNEKYGFVQSMRNLQPHRVNLLLNRREIATANAQHATIRALSTKSSEVSETNTLQIGDVSLSVPNENDWRLVRGYDCDYGSAVSPTTLEHLRWMMQKMLLKQDMFLVGPPGPSRRRLAMRFAELTNMKVEIVTITRDTTESDLKQRREIINGTSVYADQAPVRAALDGCLLILDGIEKAERNVLPTLNNLLENREMQLDDGRFLVSPERFDALLAEGSSEEELKRKGLLRSHPDFRVIALGVPVPPYKGKPLDPPLRSRFQARAIAPPSPSDQWVDMVASAPSEEAAPVLKGFAAVSNALNQHELGEGSSTGNKIPHFPHESLRYAAFVIENFPEEDPVSVLSRLYPYFGATGFPFAKEHVHARKVAELALDQFDFSSHNPLLSQPSKYEFETCERISENLGRFQFRGPTSDIVEVEGPVGPFNIVHRDSIASDSVVFESEHHLNLLTALMQDHCAGRDLLLVGSSGSGKSVLVRTFVRDAGYGLDVFNLYHDMTARDLLQRRTTDASGNSIWENSPLVQAAIDGRLVVLDGLDRLHPDTLTIVQRLITDREVHLFDGRRLTASPVDASDDQLIPIHPSFRVVALASPPTEASRWFTEEAMSMFGIHVLQPLSVEEQFGMLQSFFPKAPQDALESLMTFAATIQGPAIRGGEVSNANPLPSKGAADTVASSVGIRPLSTRTLLRLARKMNAYPEVAASSLYQNIFSATMGSFLPVQQRVALDTLLRDAGVIPEAKGASPSLEGALQQPVEVADKVTVSGETVQIGDVVVNRHVPHRPELVPRPVFFDIPRHVAVMRDMLRDVATGERHLMLIGNQGVGKNKLADRVLQLLNKEREYVQLHRDSTVGSLTLSPSLNEDGVIVWEDSPLVRAIEHGRTLMVDEADKAPLEVVSVLKSLVEDEEMLLADGRKVLSPARCEFERELGNTKVVPIHPDFSMWVLANRPGFPFLGNNLFVALGDIFSMHVVSNPDQASEVALLRAYAPSVETGLLERIAAAFAELRGMVEEGSGMLYPYSTREAVAIAKHLERFPQDGLVTVLENVFAFDQYDSQLRLTIAEVFQRHDIPLPVNSSLGSASIELVRPTPLPEARVTETWKVGKGH